MYTCILSLSLSPSPSLFPLSHLHTHTHLISIHRLRGCGRSDISPDRSGSTWSMGPTSSSAGSHHGPMRGRGRGRRRRGHSSCWMTTTTIVCILAAWRVLVGRGGVATTGVTAHRGWRMRNRVHITTTVHVRLWRRVRKEGRREGGQRMREREKEGGGRGRGERERERGNNTDKAWWRA